MQPLAEALRDLDEKKVYALVDEQVAKGMPVTAIIAELNDGMVAVGELFAAGTYFLSELIFSGEILASVTNRLEPLLQGAISGGNCGKVVIGTVKGDIHDIGKNIVTSLLRGSGFEVVDMGVDVPTEAFAAKVKETGAKVVGLAALLNFTYPEIKNIIGHMAAQGLRDGVAVIIGGAPCNEQVRKLTGADYFAPDAVTAVNICKSVYKC
jgi:methylmalonyl-CoA mutase cobalamin-binding domain/chain